MPIGSFRWHGVTVKRGHAVVVSPISDSVSQADGDRVTARERATVAPCYRVTLRECRGGRMARLEARERIKFSLRYYFTVSPLDLATVFAVW